MLMSISVLISVYDKEKPEHLHDCLVSLAQQTRQDFEIVLVEDGPLTDSLANVIAEFRSRLTIKSVVLAENSGLAKALNAGLKECRFELIARMDADDVALPLRLEAQYAFMRANPEIAVCSSWIDECDESMEKVLYRKELPTDHADIVAFAKFRNPVSHPVAMYRKDAVLSVNGYPDVFPEDYGLWSLLLLDGFRFANIPQVLLRMRTGASFIERRGFRFLKGELGLLRFQRDIGFLTSFECYRNMFLRTALRLPPKPVRQLLYRFGRSPSPLLSGSKSG